MSVSENLSDSSDASLDISSSSASLASASESGASSSTSLSTESFLSDSSELEEESLLEDCLSEPHSEAEDNDLFLPEGSAAFTTSLYEGADITIFESCLLAFQYAIKHSLTAKAFSELLDLISVHLPTSTQLPKSVHCLKKIFIGLFPHATYSVHTYCCSCMSTLNSDHNCTTSGCHGSKKGQFISIPLSPQIQHMMEDEKTWSALQKRFELHAPLDGTISDVYDGRMYKKHTTFLSQPANISLLINTDGVALFNSSQVSLWPVWVIVNELPKSQRYLKKNVLLAGMWLSRDDPPMNMFLRPIIEEINNIYTEGVDVCTPLGQLKCHAMLLQCSADLPARAHILNMKQFNGRYGCIYCNSEGITTPLNRLHRFWPHDATSAARTHQSIMDDASTAVGSRESVRGIKGPTVLALHPPFQLPEAVVVDDLHCQYLGVSRYMLNMWFSKGKGQDYYIGRRISDCNKKLMKIKVPDVFSRTPRSLDDIAHWKGSELRNWLLFYSLPVLSGILPEPYISHFSLLVAALMLLSSEKIAPLDIVKAADYLRDFYMKFPDLYGEKCATMNIHLLHHLVDCVKNWGPLWVYTCFVFETMNGHLKRLFHGTKDMTKQMAFSYIAMQTLPSTLDMMSTHSPSLRVALLADLLFNKKGCRFRKQPISSNKAVIGATSSLMPPPAVIVKINNYLLSQGCPSACCIGDRLQVAYRVELDGRVFYSSRYRRVTKRNSFTVLYKDLSFQFSRVGIVQFYVLTSTKVLAIVRVLNRVTATCQEHFHLLSPAVNSIATMLIPVLPPSDELDVTDLNHIEQKCLYIDCCDVHEAKYVVCFPPDLHD